jgi:hypothetical protein
MTPLTTNTPKTTCRVQAGWRVWGRRTAEEAGWLRLILVTGLQVM